MSSELKFESNNIDSMMKSLVGDSALLIEDFEPQSNRRVSEIPILKGEKL